ncbi:hypothetical protein SteCoe_32789 [Stentor coeruleus]|uniref:Uncharacterized protein n=1 Tax=Stentor coeruleus TaxID=5963 RepID=A0A1R2AY85_9CILI|nr:hypothetical protein SteCoe_32789 [Stentor coeruleus]
MEIFLVFGTIVGLIIMYFAIERPKILLLPEDVPGDESKEVFGAGPEEEISTAKFMEVFGAGPEEEISTAKFMVKERQDKLLGAMSERERDLFLNSAGYRGVPTIKEDKEFVKYTNVCMTVLLILAASALIYYLAYNKLPWLPMKSDL